MTTVTTDIGGIRIAWNRIQHIIKYIDRPMMCSGVEGRGVIVGTILLPNEARPTPQLNLVFTRKGVELWEKTYIHRPAGHFDDESYECLEAVFTRLVPETIPGKAVEEFVNRGGDERMVFEGIERTILRSIRDKQDAIASLELALKSIVLDTPNPDEIATPLTAT